MRKCLSALLCLAVLLSAAGCAAQEKTASLDTAHPLYAQFTAAYPERDAFLSATGDCNGDGIEDLIVVYVVSATENALVTVYSSGDTFALSAPIPAPLENCLLQWKDIDEQSPTELLVSGQKGAHLGYAIFRFEENAWVSLFGDGMDGCC